MESISLLLDVSGTTQQDTRQSPDVQQVGANDFGFEGISPQLSFTIEDPTTATPGAETSMITAVINATNKDLLTFIA